MNRHLIIGLLMIASLHANGQSPYKFQVLVDRYNPVKVPMPVTLEINGARVTSNSDGIIKLVLDPSSRFINVHSTDPGFLIIYPLDGHVFIPASNVDIPAIVIGKPNPQQMTLEAIRILKQLDSIRNDLKEEKVNNIDEVLLSRQDSILAIAKNKYAISDKDLRTAREVMEGRDKNYREITVALNNYLNQAKNLRDAFSNIAAFAFSNQKAWKLLDSTIYLYSNAYEAINNQHSAWEQDIRNFWFSTELALNFHNLIDFTLNDLHREYFLMMNEDVIKQINLYFNENNSRVKKQLKQDAMQKIAMVLPHLNNRITILESKINDFMGIISAQNNDYQKLPSNLL